MTNKQYFTQAELLESLREALTDSDLQYYDDLIHEAYNTVYYIDGSKEAKEALEQYGVFDAIEKVEKYEMDSFGEIYTKLSDPLAVANMLYYVLGIDTLYSEYSELEEAYYSVLDQEVNAENNRLLLEVIDELIAGLK